MTTRLGALAGCLLIAGGVTVSAHHSHAAFDISEWVTVEGTVTEVNWANPHVIFFMEGRKVDETSAPVTKWIMENPGINNLQKTGWSRTTVGVGARVVAKGHPVRGAGQMVLVREVTVGDKVYRPGVGGIPLLEEQERRQREGRTTTDY